MESLGYSRSWRIPAHELSGLGLRRRRDGGEEMLAVSNNSFRVLSSDTGPGATISRSRSLDDAVAAHTKGNASEWEGIAADGAGRIFVLQEEPGHVFVFDSAAKHLIQAIALHVPDSGAGWERSWRRHHNARGETLVLLDRGRIPVIKQKDPVVLVEFGPRDDRAPDIRFLAHGDQFELPVADELRPRRTWLLDGAAARELESISDAAVLGDRLFVLSAASRCIAELEPLPAGGGAAGLKREPWTVPDDIEQPEGLVVLPASRRPIVAADLERGDPRDNAFLLDPLPG